MWKWYKEIIRSRLKVIPALIFVGVLLLLFAQTTLGAISPWTQTDWSGGSGQTSWFDNTKFSSSSNTNVGATGQISLSKQTELFSNDDFETNLDNWSEVATYSGEIINTQTANAVGYWQLNETSGGTVTDSSSQANNGSFSNVTLNNSTGPDNQPVAYWNGTNSYANIYSTGLNNDFNGNEGSLSVWFKSEDVVQWSDGTTYYLVNLQSESGDFVFMRMQNNAESIMIGHRSGGVEKYYQAFFTGLQDQWNHLLLTWSDSNDQLIVYQNGTSVNTKNAISTWTGSLLSTGNVIGARNTTPLTPWKGNLAHVAVWNTPLSSTEATSLSTALNISATRSTSTTYGGSTGSVQLVTTDEGIYTQNVNVGDTETYVLEGYAYTDGTAVTNADLQLHYNGSPITTTFTDAGGGWYKMLGTVVGANESRNYGVQVKASKTVYVDNMSLSLGYNSAGTITSSIFNAETPSGWGTLTYSTNGEQTSAVKIRTSNNADMSGATDFGSCTAISSGADISGNSCVSDSQQYIQYQVSLSTNDVTATPVFQDISIAFSGSSHTAKTYYIDATSGSDSNNGTTTTTPWQTITKVNTAIYSGVIQPGDTILFKKGETFVGSIDVDVSGSSGSIITFGAYGSGNKPIINATGNASGIDLEGRSYINISDLNVKNASTQGIYLYNSVSNVTIANTDIDSTTNAYYINTGIFSNITIQNSTITNSTYGIRTAATTSVLTLTIDDVTASSGTNGVLIANSGSFSNVTISDSTFSSHSDDGLSIMGTHTNLTIDTVVANDNGNRGLFIDTESGSSDLNILDSTFNSNTDSGIQLIGDGDDASITNTTTSNNDWDGMNFKGNWTNIVVDGCTSDSNGIDGIGGDGDAYTGHNNVGLTIRNSTANNNFKGAVVMVDASTLVLEYNIFTHSTNGTVGLVAQLGSGNATIYNNVLYSGAQTGVGIEIGRLDAKTVTIRNNILYGFNYAIFQDTPYSSTVNQDYDIIFNYGTLDTTGFTEGGNTSNSDPLFTTNGSDFSLQSTSPAIDTGTDVGLTRDYIGTAVPQGSNPDRGAYEFDDTAPTISNVLASIGSNEATITWTTNENASSITDYGSSSSYGSTTSETDTSPRVTSHTINLTGLSSCTTYHYRVRSKDFAGNEGTSSDITFKTSCNFSAPATAVAPVCSSSSPTSAPWLYGAIPQDSTSILIYFTDAGDPVDRYAIEYGTEPGNYQWAADNIGGKGMRTYLVQSLQSNKTYYFRVRGGNGCATGEWSNELSAKTKTAFPFNQLTTTDFALEPEPIQKAELPTEIEESDTEYEEEMSADTTEEQLVEEGYDVNVFVKDANDRPVGGVHVTMHSKVQETYTDENGVARFENVEPGDHRVIIAYNGFEGEQSINLTGDVKEFNLNVQVTPTNPFLSKQVIGVISLLSVIIASMFVYLFVTRRKIKINKLS